MRPAPLYLLLGTFGPEDLARRITTEVGSGSRVTITPLSDRIDIGEAASALAFRLSGRGIVMRTASPVEDGEQVEGMRIEIEEGAVSYR